MVVAEFQTSSLKVLYRKKIVFRYEWSINLKLTCELTKVKNRGRDDGQILEFKNRNRDTCLHGSSFLSCE